ncbi:hypothetical protein D9619_005409 [Psilocybe cf. subviscida]|uniref:Uncharacterized protein n=1 Tax=Psilocybe cf. subviscida TaxID=2480587 RepID=A0A8H5BWF5_9AGAR|nr:hypothetical protein D9619_005409 [Psilocybe cf. subviscida]
MSLVSNPSEVAENTSNRLQALDDFGVRGSLIGVIISAVLYGMAVLISVVCVRLLISSKQIYHSKRRLFALCLHNGLMLVCGTEALVSECWLTVQAIERKLSLEMISAAASLADPGIVSTSSSVRVNLSPIVLPLTVWGADGFLIWRCLVLYKGVRGFHRVMLYVFLGSLALMKLIGGCILYYYTSPSHPSVFPVQLLVFSLTAVGNILVSAVIAARLLYAERLSTAFRSPDSTRADSPYIRALVICVESSGLIAIVALVGVVATITLPHEYNQIIPMIFPQLCVISPLLIVYRIALGRESHIIRQQDTQVLHTLIVFNNAATLSVNSSHADHGEV